MNKENEKPERIRQEKIKKNPTGNLHDALNRGDSEHLPDLTGSSSWISTGILILVIIASFIIVSISLT